MRTIAFCGLLFVSACATACGAGNVESPGTLMPEPPPPLPEPTLVRNGPVFAYDAGHGPLAAIAGPNTVLLEVAIDRGTVRLRTPSGWTASYAGHAAWFERGSGSTRIVVYPVADHAAEFRDLWVERDAHDPAVMVSPVSSFTSDRHPLLYTYRRTDDGRCGVVYALLTVQGDPASGIVVHGSWPCDEDRELRPIAVAAANGVTVLAR